MAVVKKHVKKFLDISDLDVVVSALRRHQYSGTNYKEFGLALGLLSSTLDAIAANNPSNVSNCLMDCLEEWLKKVDKVEEKGSPTWYTLIATLREIKENSVADGIDQEKHPACSIFAQYQANKFVVEILPRIVEFLYNEKIIGEMLPPTVEVRLLLKEVKQAVCADYQNLEKFATILCKFEITLPAGRAIMKEYAQFFSGNNAIEEMTPAHGERKDYQVRVNYVKFTEIRQKFASTVCDACHDMSAIPIDDLKFYLRHGYSHLRPELDQCQSKDDILGLISKKCSLIDISLLESVAIKFNIQAKSVICQYKESMEIFCKVKLRQYLNEKFSAGSCLSAETITFLVDRSIDDYTLNDVRILIATAFNDELSPNVKLVVIREGNSFIVTCSFPLILSELLIAAALENINLLKEKRVQRLTIGYCTVYNEQKEDKVNEAEKVHESSEQQLKHFYTSVYTSKDTLEQITVSLNVQLMNSQSKNRTEEDEVQVITEKFIPFDTKESKDDEKDGVWSHETTLSCDVDYQKPKDYERSTKYTSDEIAEQNSPALTFEDIVKFGNTIKESDGQKLSCDMHYSICRIQTDEKIPKTGNSEKSEGHNGEFDYLQTQITYDTNEGPRELNTGLRYYNYRRNSIFETMVEDIVTSLVVPPSSAGDILDYIIFKEEVPVTTCLVLATGLPSSGKTTALEDTFRELIKLKERAKWTFEEYLSRKRNKKCLSVYELCILGGAPRDQFAWSFATNRYGAVFSILHILARKYSFHKQLKSMNEQPAERSFFDDHVQWLITQVNLQLERIEANEPEKFHLIQDGLSLINVMDIGVNKALYEFLQIMVSSCRRHIRLAFFSLDRDAPPNLDKIPDLSHDRYKDRGDDAIMLKQKPRVDYLLHFATLGYQKDQQDSATVMIATERKSSQTASTSESLEPAKRAILERAKHQGVDQYLKVWETVNTNNMEQVKDIGRKIQSLIKNRYYSKVNIPLRWIMLRSLVTALESGDSKEIIMRKEFIVEQAEYFKMDQEEVEKFLNTFTDFGSILYMPQFESLRNIVIVDIWEFAQCLDKLFYPDPKAPHAENLLKYGIISLQSIMKILPPEIINDFLKILTTIAMIAEVKSESSILINQVQLQSSVYYYLPSARIGKSDTARNENDFIFLQIEGASFPSSLQAGISNEIMKDEEVVLVATEDCNTSQFLFKSSHDSPIEINIEMIYKDGKTQLRVKNNLSDASQFTAAVNACSKALTATFKCLQRMAKTLRGMKYLIAIPCCSPRSSGSECHYLYRAHKSDLCGACSKDVLENKFRSCWSEASKKCEFLPYDMSINEERPSNVVREYGEEIEQKPPSQDNEQLT